MRKFLVLFLLALLLIAGISQETAMALTDQGGEEPGNVFQFLPFPGNTPMHGYVGDTGRGSGLNVPTETKTPQGQQGGSGSNTTGGPPENALTWNEIVARLDGPDWSGVTDNYMYNISISDLLTFTPHEWHWDINNHDGQNGDANRVTDTVEISHTFNYTGSYTLRGTPYGEFREYEIIHYTTMETGSFENADGTTSSYQYEVHRSRREFVQSWTDFGNPVQVYRAIIGLRDLDREIFFPGDNTSLPPLPPLKFELTE